MRLRVSSATLPTPASEALLRCPTAGECSPSLNPAGRSPSPPGIGMPAALWGDVGGVPLTAEPLRLNYRRGHRLTTDSELPPAPARSAGLNFAVILLSKAIGRDHLIHRKRSPFLRGEGLNAPESGRNFKYRTQHFQLRRAKHCRVARPRANAHLRSTRRGEAHRRPGSGCRPPCGEMSEGFRGERNPSD